MSKVLSIVIPVYNKYNFTKSCLNDLKKLSEEHEIIIVDNASSDNTKENLENDERIVYYRNEENLGFAKACNKGYQLSTAPNVLFLNNDIRVKSNYNDWTKPLIEKCKDGLVGPTMGLLDKNLNFIKEENKFLEGNSYMSGWCLASSKENFKKLAIKRPEIKTDIIPQIFCEDFGLAYFEDTDLSFRARKLGMNMFVVNIPVVHFGKQTSSQLNTRQLYTKAKQIFINKWS